MNLRFPETRSRYRETKFHHAVGGYGSHTGEPSVPPYARQNPNRNRDRNRNRATGDLSLCCVRRATRIGSMLVVLASYRGALRPPRLGGKTLAQLPTRPFVVSEMDRTFAPPRRGVHSRRGAEPVPPQADGPGRPGGPRSGGRSITITSPATPQLRGLSTSTSTRKDVFRQLVTCPLCAQSKLGRVEAGTCVDR